MQTNDPAQTTGHQTIQRLLKEAKRLHRTAISKSSASSLPILRRLLASKTLRDDTSLPELYRSRHIIQRKHILHLLAFEAGYTHWVDYRKAIKNMPAEEVMHYSILLRDVGYPNLWFASLGEAKDFAAKHGGRPVAVGEQAVVVPAQRVS